jgi:hypothetical protein
VQGLDYERSKEHRLVIGTEQAKAEALSGAASAVPGDAAGAAPTVPGDAAGAPTTILLVRVLDTNDMAPEFTRLPPGQRMKS